MHPVKIEAIVIVTMYVGIVKIFFRKYATSFILLLSIDGSFVTTNCEICKGPNQMTPQSSVDVATTDSRTKYEIKALFRGQHLSRVRFSKGRGDRNQNVA